MTRRWVWAVVLCATVRAAAAQRAGHDSALGKQIAAMVAEPAVARAHWGVMVTGLDGTKIFGLNEGQLFQPASNAKLFTTAAALALLGPDTRFQTTVQTWSGQKPSMGATMIGPIMIHGGGDANLSGRTVPYESTAARKERVKDSATAEPQPLRYLEELADQVAAGGWKIVDGDVVGDDSYFPWQPYPSDWSIDDMVWGYGAPVSALTINDNQMRLTVAPGRSQAGEMTVLPTFVPDVPYYKLDVKVAGATAKKSELEMERAPGSKDLRIFGQMAQDAEPDVEEIAIQDPAEFAAVAFKAMLQARGIEVRGVARAEHFPVGYANDVPAKTPVAWADLAAHRTSGFNPCPQSIRIGTDILATHSGPTVAEDIVVTNKVSQNLHAELLLHHLGKLAFCGLGSTNAGLAVERSFLLHAGLDAGDFVFFDGSGLSGHDLVTPRATAKLLSYAARDPTTGVAQTWFADWKKSLPVGGEDGPLAARFAKAPLKDHVFAKTGTLGEARALSGYVECASGRTVIFSIMVGNHMPGTNADREVMDRIVGAIAAAE